MFRRKANAKAKRVLRVPYICSLVLAQALAMVLAIAPLLLSSTPAYSQPSSKPKAKTKAEAQTKAKAKPAAKPINRQIIKGKFKLESILTEKDNKKQLWFKGRTAHGKPLSLVLVSRYTHPRLRAGESYQLAAEVGATKKDYHVLNKALVYFSGGGTTIPVWIMADHASLSLDVEKYLKMHAPSSDYLVL